MTQIYECSVKGIEPLRYSGMYRVNCSDSEYEVVLEMHEKLMRINEGDRLVVSITTNEEECLENDFCGRGYVVSIRKLDDRYRVVISISGILVVIKQKQQPRSPFKVMNELYVGVRRK
jgi:DNA-directed RNA polymerase subunit G